LSELPKHKMTDFAGYQRSSSTTCSGVKNGKHSAKLFELDMDCTYNSWHTPKSDFWNIAEVDMDNGGLFVIIDKFNAELPKTPDMYTEGESASSLINKIKDLKAAGITVPKVYAVKVKQRTQLESKDDWQNFYDFAKDKTLEKLSEGSLTQSYVDWKASQDFSKSREGHWGHYRDDIMKSLLNVLPSLADNDGDLASLLKQYKAMSSGGGDTKKLQKLVEIAKEYATVDKLKAKPTHNLDESLKTVLKKYSMLKHVDSHGWRWDKTKALEEDVVNYVNVIDLCNKN
jgi:hypothetical protein